MTFTSDCGNALRFLYRVHQPADDPDVGGVCGGTVPRESQNKIPDAETVQRELMNMVDTVRSRLSPSIRSSGTASFRRLGTCGYLDRDVLSVLVMFASRMQIQQVTVDEENFILKEDVLDLSCGTTRTPTSPQ